MARQVHGAPVVAALFLAGLATAGISTVWAKPPAHAPAHGYRAKHADKADKRADKSTRKHEKFHEKQSREHDRFHAKQDRERGKRKTQPARQRERPRDRKADLDRDGIPDYRDNDIDGDGRRNRSDRYPRDPRRW